jgi:hypothetical protein
MDDPLKIHMSCHKVQSVDICGFLWGHSRYRLLIKMGLGVYLKWMEIVVTYHQRIVERNDILRRVELFG